MSKKITTASFIAKSRKIHGDRYSYDKTVYASAKTHVIITYLVEGSYKGMNQPATLECSIHGVLEPRLVTNIFSGDHPCILCAGTEAFRGYTNSQARQVLEAHFGGESLIENFVYSGKDTNVTLVCPKHGPWQIQFRSYLRSRGCRKCLEPQNMEARKLGLRSKAEATRDAGQI